MTNSMCINVQLVVLRVEILTTSPLVTWNAVSDYVTFPTIANIIAHVGLTDGIGRIPRVLGKLTAFINHDRDINLRTNVETIRLRQPNIVDSLNTLIVLNTYFTNYTNVRYNLFPEEYPFNLYYGYNSNSFVRGFLGAANISIPQNPTKNVLGWATPLPSRYFGVTE